MTTEKLNKMDKTRFLLDAPAPEVVGELIAELRKAQGLLELAWGVIANVDYGKWENQNRQWVPAAQKWRDDWLKFVSDAHPAHIGPSWNPDCPCCGYPHCGHDHTPQTGVSELKEGAFNKGGVGMPPTTPRPAPPCAQGNVGEELNFPQSHFWSKGMA